MSQRFHYRQEQAEQHDLFVGIYGGETEISEMHLPRGSPARLEMADYHARMRRKWEYAAMRPWLPVEPDPPRPEP
jgi:hypothetical protein